MPKTLPLVSVIMQTYNHEAFIGRAIEGVLMQQTTFPFELILGEDASTDRTREICEQYREQYPDRITLLPSEPNMGTSRNFMRIFPKCRGKYIANCDGDDYWTAPHKLQKQADFLEQNPDYGLVFTDVQTVDPEDRVFSDPDLEERRLFYASGAVFFKLLEGNFINASTVMYRKDRLIFDTNDAQRYWFIYDYWRWLQVSVRAKIKYLDLVTCHYRKHPGGATNQNFIHKKRSYYVLHDIISTYHQLRQSKPGRPERLLLFRKMLSLLYRRSGSIGMKWQIARIIPGYLPDIRGTIGIFLAKFRN